VTSVSVPTAADYLAAGLKLIAIPRGSKAPKDDGWQLEQNCIRTIEQAGRLNGKNIGIAHLWSGTCAVDADDYLAAATWLAKRGIALDGHLAADDAVQISSGRPNRCKLWYRLPDRVPWLPTLNLRESYGVGLELRCACERWLCDRRGYTATERASGYGSAVRMDRRLAQSA
jgi:hypothetical protein